MAPSTSRPRHLPARALLVLMLLALLAAMPGAPRILAPAAADPATRSAQTAFRDRIGDLRIPGAAVSVSGPEGSWTLTTGSDGDGRPVTEHTPFLIGSVSKSFTALVTISLMEEGRIDLDDTAAELCPELDLGEITVRDLLQHTSGYDAAQGLAAADRFDVADGALRRAAGQVAADGPDGPRGELQYSDANYLLLGALLEQVTGRPLPELLHERVLDPVGMRDAIVTAEEAASLPPGHRSWWGRWIGFDAGYDESGVPYGYIGTSVVDLAAYADASFGPSGPLPVSTSGRERMQSIQVPGASAADGSPTGYGYGWRVGQLEGSPLVEHTGADPGYFAHVLWLPAQQVRVVLVANVYSEGIAEALVAIGHEQALLAAGKDPSALAHGSPGALRAGPWVTAGAALLGAVLLMRSIARAPRTVRPGRAGIIGAGLVAASAWAMIAGGSRSVLGYPWRMVLLWMPDLGWSLLAVAVLWSALAITGVVRRRTGAGTAARAARG